MENIMKKTLVITSLSLTMLASAAARADGVAIAPEAIPEAERATLVQQIAEARAQTPDAFDAVAAVDTYKPEGIRRSRNNKPDASRAFMRLGRPALMPMIELLAFQAERGSLTEEQWSALGDGLLHAIAFLRDDRAASTLEAVFLGSDDAKFVRKAGEGLGMLCGSRQQRVLLTASRETGPRRLGAITGLGWCRTKASVKRLAAIMAEPLDAKTAAATAKALGYVGSSWGLSADKSIPADRAETIQRIAAEALVDQYPRFGKKVRATMQTAVLMVEYRPSVGRLESMRRRVDQPMAKELDDLRDRLERALSR
jgi:hypothetical protein